MRGNAQDLSCISYLRRHLHQPQRALTMGVPVSGYFVSSLMDNFEWAYGTSKRFGLIRVDYPTLKRTIKSSDYWYRDIVRNNALH